MSYSGTWKPRLSGPHVYMNFKALCNSKVAEHAGPKEPNMYICAHHDKKSIQYPRHAGSREDGYFWERDRNSDASLPFSGHSQFENIPVSAIPIDSGKAWVCVKCFRGLKKYIRANPDTLKTAIRNELLLDEEEEEVEKLVKTLDFATDFQTAPMYFVGEEEDTKKWSQTKSLSMRLDTYELWKRNSSCDVCKERRKKCKCHSKELVNTMEALLWPPTKDFKTLCMWAFFTEKNTKKMRWKKEYWFKILRMGPQTLKQKALQVYCNYFNDTTCTTAANTNASLTEASVTWLRLLEDSFPDGGFTHLKCFLLCAKKGESEFRREHPHANPKQKEYHSMFLKWLEKQNHPTQLKRLK